jgi:outer membrane protein assembly factor BamB
MSIYSRHHLKPFWAISILLFLSVLLSACSGGALTASGWPGVSIEGETVYVAYGLAVYAFDINTGRELWRFPSEPDRSTSFYAVPALEGEDLVVVGGYDNQIYALDMNGNPVWAQPFDQAEDRYIGAPIIAEDVILAPSADGRLFALELESGRPAWSTPFQANESPGPLWSAPVVAADKIYLASLDHHLYAIELATGREIWRTDDLGAAISDSPTLTDGLILVGTFGEELIAVDPQSGNTVWTFVTSGWVWSNPAVGNGAAYFGDTAGIAYAVDVSSGREIWQKTINGAIAATPAYEAGRVYFVTESGTVHAADATNGKALWPTDVSLNGKLLSDPLLSGDSLILGTSSEDCLIVSIATESGANRCLFQPSQ